MMPTIVQLWSIDLVTVRFIHHQQPVDMYSAPAYVYQCHYFHVTVFKEIQYGFQYGHDSVQNKLTFLLKIIL